MVAVYLLGVMQVTVSQTNTDLTDLVCAACLQVPCPRVAALMFRIHLVHRHLVRHQHFLLPASDSTLEPLCGLLWQVI